MSNDWKQFDAANQSVGRLATQVASWLIGKDMPAHAHHIDPKRHAVVINCDQLPMSERRGEELKQRHTGYIGHLKETKKKDLPRVVIMTDAVFGMMPKNKLGSAMFKRLHCFADDTHPYNGQING